ncbi:glycosyltransferase family 2 protein [Rhizobium leguminosarum]|uniref:glycosyltransferase n=1 Tax=Rhizobium leguminosarum TaxID=384 RepID=UPI0010314242|nr:glycosyltransferase [Rhizobium leguminosarum]TAU97544.1 glycosyltransferase family 2 protein [Rhizobium leguminosarum]TAV12367.1 glycosyltransferase family 2 protein [Rhizobium leguminosarum]TAW53144.1 glycosyltransferase family 2 protein [Rhizobium leguminosarum]TAX52127.1 glycosyltransferase family 2 protein [Rhizobium leguminosarum]TAY38632.1 glycosyltransferase family 2 protein [Rhizobium leguminosarum]
MSAIKVTILFSTYNGAKTLPRMLEALTQTTLPRDQWKIVAVDNNSKDATAEILKTFQARLPLEVYFEPKQGKENALATGFKHLEGQLAILTDDDVIPDPDWVEQFVRLAEEQPDYNMFGGLILPEWEQQPEDWVLKYAHMSILYAVNSELEIGPIPAYLIFGPNSAFRRSIIGEDYVVHANLGPNAVVKQYAMGQDTAFALRLEKKGGRAYHSTKPRIRHIIKKEYVSEGWILGRAERYGKGMVILRPELFDRKFKVKGVPVGAFLTWTAMKPVIQMMRYVPRSKLSFKIKWNQGLRKGIIEQFNEANNRSAAGVK